MPTRSRAALIVGAALQAVSIASLPSSSSPDTPSTLDRERHALTGLEAALLRLENMAVVANYKLLAGATALHRPSVECGGLRCECFALGDVMRRRTAKRALVSAQPDAETRQQSNSGREDRYRPRKECVEAAPGVGVFI